MNAMCVWGVWTKLFFLIAMATKAAQERIDLSQSRLDGVEIVMLWQLIMWQGRRQWLCDATNRQRSFGLDRGSSCSGGTACTDRSEPS